MYTIKYHRLVVKKLKKLNPNDQKKIVKKIHKLKQNPQNPLLNIKRLQGKKSTYRLRVDRLRILFTINEKEKTILIEMIGYRGDIYKH